MTNEELKKLILAEISPLSPHAFRVNKEVKNPFPINKRAVWELARGNFHSNDVGKSSGPLMKDYFINLNKGLGSPEEEEERPDYSSILPKELYLDAKKGKRGKGMDMLNAVNTRLTMEEYNEFMELLYDINVKRSNFVRYAIQKVSKEVRAIIDSQDDN